MDPEVEGRRAIEVAAQNLQRTSRHARSLEYLASGLASAGLLVAIALCAALHVVLAALVLMAALTAWGLVRAVALVLHLRVDETMVQIAEGDDAPSER
jgi:hypothetical protein